MTDFCQTVSMSFNSPLRFTPLSKSHWFFFIFGTLSGRVISGPTLRNLSEKGGCSLWSRPQVSCMGLLKFSLFEAVEKSVRYSIRAIFNS